MESKALVVVDMQNDFVSTDGSLSVSGALDIVPKINKLRNNFDTVLFSFDWHPENHVSFYTNHPGNKPYDVVQAGQVQQVLFPPHCVQETNGSKLQKDIVIEEKDIKVFKGTHSDVDSYSCFADVIKSNKTDADDKLKQKGINTLYFAGVATDYCVKSSVIDALELGYKVYVYQDCIAPVNPEDGVKAIEEMKAKGAIIIQSGF